MKTDIKPAEAHVLVTGGTGFIGSRVVRELVRKGVRVRSLSHASRPSGVSAAADHEIVHGDIRDAAVVRRAVKGITHIAHLAARVSAWESDPLHFYNVNVGGTRSLLLAGLEEEVTAFVHVSSASAIEFRGDGILDERSIVRRTANLSDYGHSKALAEQEVLEAGNNGMSTIIVYPTRVFGIGSLVDSNAATRVLDLHLRGRMPVLPGMGKDYANWAYVEDVASGVVRALFHGHPGNRYILGGENTTLKECFALADRLAGQDRTMIPIPHAIGKMLVYAEERWAHVAGRHPRLTTCWYESIFENVQLSCRRAIDDLGYSVTPLKEALAQVVEWLLQGTEDRKNPGNLARRAASPSFNVD